MIAKFSEAFRLFGQHLGLFTAIILTVSLPANILVDYVANAEASTAAGVVRLSIWIEGIFGPIYIGAILYSLYQIKSGRAVTYKEAIAVGFKKWGLLFAARLVAGLLIGFGSIAFVIPGVILAVRYSLLEAAVVIEGEGVSGSRARSAALTAGRRWQIFGAAVLFFIPFFALSVGIYLPLAFVESLKILPVEILLDCMLDVAFGVLQIVIFLFYWEASEAERSAEQGAAPDDDLFGRQGNSRIAEGLPRVDDNPYRSPASEQP